MAYRFTSLPATLLTMFVPKFFPSMLLFLVFSPLSVATSSCTSFQYCVLEHAIFTQNNTIEATGAFTAPLSLKAVERGAESRIMHVVHGRNSDAGVSMDQTYVFKESYFSGNIGHVLGDDAFVIFTRLFSLGLGPASNVTVLLSEAADGPSLESLQRGPIIRELYHLVTDRPLALMREGLSSPAAYARLIVGWDRLTYAIRGRSDDVVPLMPLPLVEAFRRRALAYAGLPLTLPAAPTLCDVLIVEKNASVAEHVYSINNAGALVAALREAGCRAQATQWAGVAFRQQIALIAHRPIVVALPGSDVMNCIFQPTHSGMLLPHRCSDQGCEDSNEVTLWFAKLPHRKVMQFPRDDINLVWHGTSLTWRVAHFVAAVRAMVKQLQEAAAAR